MASKPGEQERRDATVTVVKPRAGSSRRTTRARLVVVEGPGVGRRFEVRDAVVIGRSDEADWVLEDVVISRRHARIVPDTDGGYSVEDLGSRNGTLLNGDPVARRRLRFGDRIRLGRRTELLYTCSDPQEERAFEAQKMEALGRLGAGVAHDFNNLVGAIQATLEYLRAQPGDMPLSAAEVQDCLSDIGLAVDRAANLSERLTSIAHKPLDRHERLDVSTLCGELEQLLGHTLPRSIRVQNRARVGLYVRGDAVALNQVLLNLAINARDAMPQGGVLTLDAKSVPAARLTEAPVMELVDHVVISVRDTGEGMDDDTRARVFEPFFTTKGRGEGTGLGLAIVYEAVRAHGGAVTIESAPDSGTCFRIYLPELPPQDRSDSHTMPTHEELEPPQRVRALKLLLIDDEALVARSLGRLLSHHGHDVTICLSGSDGLSRYGEVSPDVVLLDLDMPGMSGRECLSRILAMHPSARVVLLSGHHDPTREDPDALAGARRFLHKP
ncbi:MAG: FHA domain-containing protein, partial [Deltaproteobacteria bacterium]|nr:FHA domain-containing protein [Deltaproteobacteria bacterium]